MRLIARTFTKFNIAMTLIFIAMNAIVYFGSHDAEVRNAIPLALVISLVGGLRSKSARPTNLSDEFYIAVLAMMALPAAALMAADLRLDGLCWLLAIPALARLYVLRHDTARG